MSNSFSIFVRLLYFTSIFNETTAFNDGDVPFRLTCAPTYPLTLNGVSRKFIYFELRKQEIMKS